METTEEVYTKVRVRRKSEFEPVGDIIKQVLKEMGIDAEREAGDMRGPILPEQRDASRDLDLIAEIEVTE